MLKAFAQDAIQIWFAFFQVDIEISFTRSHSDFYLMNSETYEASIVIEDFVLKVPCAVMAPDLWDRFLSERKTKNIIYHVSRKQLIRVQIPSGVTNFSTSSLFPNNVPPQSCIMALVKTSAYSGSKQENPYYALRKFSNTCFLSSIEILLNESHMGTFHEIATADDALHDYYRLFENLGFTSSPFSNDITYAMFLRGFYFKAVNLTTSSNSSEPYLVESVRQGQYRLQAQFSAATPFEITLMVLCDYSNTITVNKENRISCSYLT